MLLCRVWERVHRYTYIRTYMVQTECTRTVESQSVSQVNSEFPRLKDQKMSHENIKNTTHLISSICTTTKWQITT